MAKLIDCVSLFKMGKHVVPADWGFHSMLRSAMETEYNQVCVLFKNVSKNFKGGLTPVSNFNQMTKNIANDINKKTVISNDAAKLVYTRCCDYFSHMGFPY